MLWLNFVSKFLPDKKMKATFDVFILEAHVDPIGTLMLRADISQSTAYRWKKKLFQWLSVSGD
jgi:hypothetical protein